MYKPELSAELIEHMKDLLIALFEDQYNVKIEREKKEDETDKTDKTA